MVCAFEGWNDAANAATDALRFLIRQLNATDIGGLDAEDFFDFQAARPHVELANGVVKRVRWPTTRFAIARVARSERDLVIVLGVEPNLRWRTFADSILGLARDLGCSTLVSLGALVAHVPHTRPVRVTGTADATVAAQLDLQRSSYEGPTGIVGVLTDESRRAGLQTVSLWAPVPRYVATPPSPMATHALLDRLGRLTAIPLPLQSLEIAGRGWQQHVDAAIDDDNLRRWIRDLETSYDEEAEEISMFGDLVDDEMSFDEWTDDDTWEEDPLEFLDDYEDADDDDSFVSGIGSPRSLTGDHPGGAGIRPDDDDDDDDDDEFDEDDLPSGDAIARELERFLRENDNGSDEPDSTQP